MTECVSLQAVVHLLADTFFISPWPCY